MHVVHFKITWFKILCTNYDQNAYLILQTFNKPTLYTFLKHFFFKFYRCETTHRQTTDRKSTRRQKLTDNKIFTDTTTDRQRQVADTTTHRQKPIIFLYKKDYRSQLRLHLPLKLMYNGFFLYILAFDL